jgi:hypothetical protein
MVETLTNLAPSARMSDGGPLPAFGAEAYQILTS